MSYLEEFALRPLSANHVQFDDLSATLRYRRQISGGKAYEILDSLPSNGDAGDPRMQTGVAGDVLRAGRPGPVVPDGQRRQRAGELLEAALDRGGRVRRRPAAAASTRSSPRGGTRPTRSLVYKVYGRRYENALVLYKPLSYTRGETGGIGAATATTHRLDGWYRVVNADGSLGARVNQVTLRNGEGVVLAESA